MSRKSTDGKINPLLTVDGYQKIKDGLCEDDKKEIEELERDRDDLSVKYWDIYKKVFRFFAKRQMKRGVELEVFLKSPLYKLQAHILYQAALLRGMKFTDALVKA